jgi:hypothetical protein
MKRENPDGRKRKHIVYKEEFRRQAVEMVSTWNAAYRTTEDPQIHFPESQQIDWPAPKVPDKQQVWWKPPSVDISDRFL